MTKYKKEKKKETFQEELCYDPVVPTLTSLPPLASIQAGKAAR